MGGAGGVSGDTGGATGELAQAGSAGGGQIDSCDDVMALQAAVEGCYLRERWGTCLISSDPTTGGDNWGEPVGSILLDSEGRPANYSCILEKLPRSWACPDWAGVTLLYWCEIWYI